MVIQEREKIEYTPREIQMFSRNDSGNIKKKDRRPESSILHGEGV